MSSDRFYATIETEEAPCSAIHIHCLFGATELLAIMSSVRTLQGTTPYGAPPDTLLGHLVALTHTTPSELLACSFNSIVTICQPDSAANVTNNCHQIIGENSPQSVIDQTFTATRTQNIASQTHSTCPLRNHSLLQTVYDHLPLLTDLLALRATSLNCRHVGTPIITQRFDRIVGPLAVITGSCALDMLTGEPSVRTNINFIVPYGRSTVLYTFILESLKYHRVTPNRRAHVSFESTIHTFARFQQGYNTITVTEATPRGIFKVLMASPTTANMIIMTAGGLAAFYPKWTLAGITVTNHTFIQCLPVGRYSLVSFAMRSQTMWRLSEHCGNPACMHNPLNNTQTAHLPPNPMPANQWSICIQEAHIANHFLPYCGKIHGLLYTTSAITPHLVDVPFQDGVTELTNLSQLQILHWVDQLGPDRHVLTSGRFRKTYHTYMDDPETLNMYSYTFHREHTAMPSPPNAMIHELADITSNEDDVMGNVLVVKHLRGSKHDVVDCSAEDIQCVNSIIIR
ncbi:uncharacterized protein F5147DRAFT_653322 [Suillus discolor]|uniref:Uncharacterized protein n=1 Tax=Suillus discolor TaxID=1912936 RepID=A0A9P7F4Z9_9AGAM|nr:uncharacterized protein F5147DRAFT_653322 [Suillus discolor]KAG2107460.1 hypothetical protein F5147DRAFT_653322 [Suillus discolor]